MLTVKLNRVGRKELYKLVVGYNAELVEKIKTLPNDCREWDGFNKEWFVTALGIFAIIKQYKGREDIFFQFENEKQRQQFTNIITKHKNRLLENKRIQDELEVFNADVLDMKSRLPEITRDFDYTKYLKAGIIPMPHQVQAAYFATYLSERNKSTLMAMDLGTGKTLASILAVMMDKTIKKALYIVPANLRLNIQAEVELFTNEHCYVVQTTKDKKTGGYRHVKYKRNKGYSLDECKFIVLSYDYFSSTKFDSNVRIAALGLNDVDIIIFDEVHNLSNKKSNRSENIRKTYDGIVKKRIGLSATPLKNNIASFFSILKMLKPDEFTNESDYLYEYCGMYYDKEPADGSYPGWKLHPESANYAGLFEKMQTFMFRVKKEDVLKDLPPLIVNKVLIEMSAAEAKEYKAIEEGFMKVDWKTGTAVSTEFEDSDDAIVILSRLRQFTATIKITRALELIKELNAMGEKVLLFDAFKKPLYTLKELMGNDTKLYSGDQTSEQKQDLVMEFQDPNSGLNNLLISLAAGNAGITLTRASNVIQTTLSYVVSDNQQAWGRAHRKGQLEQVFVTLPLIVDTIDEDIYEILQEKETIIKAVIDGEEHADLSKISVLHDVIDRLKDKYK